MIEQPLAGRRITAAYMGRIVTEVNRNRLVAGRNVSLRRTPAGTVIDCAPAAEAGGAGGGRHPWKVRYHKPAANAAGQWEVYIPDGTLSIGSTCYVVNQPARAAGGAHADDASGWRAVPVNEAGISGRGIVRFVAHGKGSAQLRESGGVFTETAPFVAVFAEVGTGGSYNPLNDSDWKTHYPGDTWSAVIAEATVTFATEPGEEDSRAVRQILKSAVALPGDGVTAFRPVWRFTYSPTTTRQPITLESIGFDNRRLSIGTVTAEAADEDVKGSDGRRVWLHIDTTAITPQIGIVSGERAPDSSADHAYVEFLGLEDNRMTADLRANLVGMPFYRGLG